MAGFTRLGHIYIPSKIQMLNVIVITLSALAPMFTVGSVTIFSVRHALFSCGVYKPLQQDQGILPCFILDIS